MSVSSNARSKAKALEAERRLVKGLQDADRSAWQTLYKLYAPDLYRKILMPRLANTAAAEDALAETFRSAIEKFGSYTPREAGLYPWLARIAANKAMDLHRARARSGRKLADLGRMLQPLLAPVAVADDLLELRADAEELQQRVEVALEGLNPRYRRALELRFLQEKSREECAQALEVKLGTFDVLLLRALRSFQKVWGSASQISPFEVEGRD